jgi:putative hemolysin
MDWMIIAGITLTLLLICFFSGLEVSFLSVNRLSIELKKKQGSYTGKIWAAFLEKPSRFVGTTLIIFNVLLVIYGLLWGDVIESVWKYWHIQNPYIALAVETLLAAFLLVFLQFAFKGFFRAKSNETLNSGFVAFMVNSFYSLFSWLPQYFAGMAEWILKYIFNVKLQSHIEVFSKTDTDHYIQQLKMNDAEDSVELNNELFENVLSLSETRIRECLIPRKEIIAVEITASLEQIKNCFIETKLSKLVVYEDNIDNIQGYIHHLDMFKNPQSLRSLLLPIPAVPESMNATDLINKFTRERKSIAWVIDEFGGTAGIVTMEDLLEEIFGDIYDEYDTQEQYVDKQIAPNEYIFSGRLELAYLTEKYKLDFRKKEEAGTLSGYIISQHQSIPRQKDRIIIDDYQFDILSVSETRIETVKLKLLR